MKREKLSDAELETALSELAGWQLKDKHLFKRFEFSNFAESLEFVNKVGELAEDANHHPDISFGWGYAEINLITHDRKGITDVDVALAKKIGKL